jgi:hypothetical protein
MVRDRNLTEAHAPYRVIFRAPGDIARRGSKREETCCRIDSCRLLHLCAVGE